MTHSIATLHIFSGRSDPTWALKGHEWASLKSIWDRLSPCTAQDLNPPGLGYRGISAEDESHECYFTFQGYVSRKSSKKSEWRRDPTQEFEQYLLSTRPEDIIPAELVSQLTGNDSI